MKRQSLVGLVMLFVLSMGTILSANGIEKREGELNNIHSMKKFLFIGDAVDKVNLEEEQQEARFRNEMQDSTCTRQIPHQEEVCSDVIRYRQECRTVPGREECYDYDEQVCNDVTRYREECYNGPSREICRTLSPRQSCRPGPSRRSCRRTPGREVCEDGPRQEVCVDLPDREVCRNRNGRRVCRQVAGRRNCRMVSGDRTCRKVPGREICEDVPGDDICESIPGREVCRTVPGDLVCRDVSYQDTVCHSEPRTRCETIPTYEECNQIPYSVNECRMETRYSDEQYACQIEVKVPYQVIVKTKAEIDFRFDHFEDEVNSLFSILLNNNKTSIQVKDNSKDPYYIFSQVEESVRDLSDLEKVMTSEYDLFFIKKSKLLLPVTEKIILSEVYTKKMTFSVGQINFLDTVKISLKIMKEDELILETGLDLKETLIENQNNRSIITVDFNQYDIELKRGFWKKKYDIEIKVDVKPDLINKGELLMDLTQDELGLKEVFKQVKPKRD